MAIIQGEALELSELPAKDWSGESHPGRIRFQTFRPRHGEPLTDALIGQGMMSLGGSGLPYPTEVLQLWGGEMRKAELAIPAIPKVIRDDGSGEHQYAIIAVGVQGRRTAASGATKAGGLAKLRWDRVNGADAYVVVRDGKEVTGPLRIEGSNKECTDKAPK